MEKAAAIPTGVKPPKLGMVFIQELLNQPLMLRMAIAITFAASLAGPSTFAILHGKRICGSGHLKSVNVTYICSRDRDFLGLRGLQLSTFVPA